MLLNFFYYSKLTLQMMQVGLPDISRLLAMLRWAGLTLRQRKQRSLHSSEKRSIKNSLANDMSGMFLYITHITKE